MKPEVLKKMTKLEIEVTSEKASKLYDSFSVQIKDGMDAKMAFILGYLHGRENARDEMGIYESDDDDSRIYEFLQNESKKKS